MEFIAHQVMLACVTILMIMGTTWLTYAFVCAIRDFMGEDK